MLKRKSLAWESIGAVFWNFSGMAVSLANGVLTARILDPGDRGFLALAITLAGVAHTLSSVGTNVALRTFQPKSEWASYRNYLSLSSRLLIVDLAIIVLMIGIFVATGALTVEPELVAIVILSLCTFASNQLLDILNAAGKVSISASLNTAGNLATMLTLLIVYWIDGSYALFGVLMAYILAFIFRGCAVIKVVSVLNLELGKITQDRGRILLRQGSKFWGVNLGQTLTFRADQLLLGPLAGVYSVGLYSVAVTPATLMHVISNSIGQVLFRQAAVRSLTVSIYLKAQTAALVVTLAYGIGMWFASPFLIPLVFGSEYTASIGIVRILLVGEIALSFYLIIVRVLAGYDRPKSASWSGFIGLIVMVPLMFLLVPDHGAYGAAVSAVCCYFAMAIWVGFFLFRALKFESLRS